MWELTDTTPDIHVSAAEYARLLGYPHGHEMQGRARELTAATRLWYGQHGKPWISIRKPHAVQTVAGGVRIGATEFSAPQLQAQFDAAKVDRAILVAVSAGPECEQQAHQLWQEGKPDEYFFMEVFGSAVVEHLITQAGARICSWAEPAGITVLPHYSPGYPDWDVTDQHKLLALIHAAADTPLPGVLQVLDSGMLRPKKSLLAVFGLTKAANAARLHPGLVPCESCSYAPCQFRRSPYRLFRPQIEAVPSLYPAPDANDSVRSHLLAALEPEARYTLNPRALRKWAQERLQLQVSEDGSVLARFEYEGTTCSNLGQPLRYHYQVRLGPPAERYRVLEATCTPAVGDTGHALMCAYLTDSKTFMQDVAAEKPLSGQPLAHVFSWSRPYSPSGCYCDAGGRAHKWGLIFEVIHFALVQRVRGMVHGQPVAVVK